ncbi:MAG: hypothetical protein PUI84_03820 [Bacteroidales bacterium]|nr:hypothetical protein [Porphyromonas sp.]MDD6934435.1 hypothetical protein [Bacteroidales bacterium]MDY3102850.1 hypothetical protein [Porphyromonas sp.]
MNNLFKYLGSILLLIGVLVIAIPHFLDVTSNVTLGSGLALVIIGFLAHIFLNRKAGAE